MPPEFGQFETKIILDELKKIDNNLISHLFDICYESKKWEKWVDSSFIPENNKQDLIIICGHYLFSNDEFIKLTKKLDEDIVIKIKNSIKIKLMDYIK